MRRQEVICQRVEWGDRGREEEQAPDGESGEAPALGFAVAYDEEVDESEAEDGERRLGMEGPRVGGRLLDRRYAISHAGVAQLVERLPSKQDVAGSSPAARSGNIRRHS
jgi:hypothetical protein